MAKPQQPELRRSDEIASLNPDAVEGDLEGRKFPESSGTDGHPVPKANRAGTPSGPVQDKPDLDAFAAKLGAHGGDEDGDARSTAEGSAPRKATTRAKGSSSSATKATAKKTPKKTAKRTAKRTAKAGAEARGTDTAKASAGSTPASASPASSSPSSASTTAAQRAAETGATTSRATSDGQSGGERSTTERAGTGAQRGNPLVSVGVRAAGAVGRPIVSAANLVSKLAGGVKSAADGVAFVASEAARKGQDRTGNDAGGPDSK